MQNCETSTLTVPIHQLVAPGVKSCGYPQIPPKLVNQRFCPVTSVMLGKEVEVKKKEYLRNQNSASRVSKRCIFSALEEITLCFSTWKVLVISSVGVVAAYEIHLRTSLLLLQFCLSRYITDTSEKAPQDIILQFLCSSQVLPYSRSLKSVVSYFK